MKIEKQLLKVNYTKGRDGWKPDAICIHIAEGTKLGKAESCDHLGTMQEFNSPLTQKSSHYLIGEEADITQLVEETDTAYANGLVTKPTAKIVLERKTPSGQYVNPNLYTISIECAGYTDISSAQYDTLIWLVKDISKRWNIPIDENHIIPHRAIRADKRCPANISIPRVIVEATRPPMLTNPVNKMTPAQKQSLLSVIWAFVQDSALVERIRVLLGGQDKMFGAQRDPRWREMRAAYYAEHPTCAICGTTKKIEVHHIFPVWRFPHFELKNYNYISLCKFCHLNFGHLGSYRSWNVDIKADAEVWRKKVENRP